MWRWSPETDSIRRQRHLYSNYINQEIVIRYREYNYLARRTR
jgi:hypothetical protein